MKVFTLVTPAVAMVASVFKWLWESDRCSHMKRHATTATFSQLIRILVSYWACQDNSINSLRSTQYLMRKHVKPKSLHSAAWMKWSTVLLKVTVQLFLPTDKQVVARRTLWWVTKSIWGRRNGSQICTTTVYSSNQWDICGRRWRCDPSNSTSRLHLLKFTTNN